VLFAKGMIDAVEGPLEDCPDALDTVCVGIVVHVLLCAVADGPVLVFWQALV